MREPDYDPDDDDLDEDGETDVDWYPIPAALLDEGVDARVTKKALRALGRGLKGLIRKTGD